MSLSRETTDKIGQFAKEQSRYYLDEAERTYLEKLRRNTSKIIIKKKRSETARDAQNDMIHYMTDYMNDLIAEGFSEQEALERAKEELKFRSETVRSADLQERFAAYGENRSPANYEAIGLFYAGFLFFGVSVGALAGFFGGGGGAMFFSGGWVDTLIGLVVGVTIGLGLGLISHAIIVLKKRG